jgi:hypothetical protein
MPFFQDGANTLPQEPQVEHSLQLCLRHICHRRRPQFHPAWQLPCFRDSCFSVFAGSLEHLHDQHRSVSSNPGFNSNHSLTIQQAACYSSVSEASHFHQPAGAWALTASTSTLSAFSTALSSSSGLASPRPFRLTLPLPTGRPWSGSHVSSSRSSTTMLTASRATLRQSSLWRATGRQVPLSNIHHRLEESLLYILTKSITWRRLRDCSEKCNIQEVEILFHKSFV